MSLQAFTTLLPIVFLSFASPLTERTYGWENPAFRLRGYVKEMPSLQFDREVSNPAFGNLIHNRLNTRWSITSNLDLNMEGRNRVIYNEMFGDVPEIRSFFEGDDGLVDLSWVWLAEGSWIGHSMIDRIYINWRNPDWRFRLGRQRINWGINLVSNPNDLFNVYSFFDFDYPERPGTDAVRLQHYLSYLSSIEIAVRPAERSTEMVAAMKYRFNRSGYDVQTIAGYYRNRIALGGGWAGNLFDAGLKGEFTWFHDLEDTPGIRDGNLVAAIGMDYMFSGGTFGVVEFLYNGGYSRNPEQAFLITEPLRADNIMFSEFAVTLSADHPFSPILRGGLALMVLPDIEALFVMPSIAYSVATDLDLEIRGQIFAGGSGTPFETAGSAWYASLQFSF